MNIDTVVEHIALRAQGRYLTGSEESSAAEFIALSSSEVSKRVFRLRRNESAGWRTILIAHAPYSEDAVRSTYSWAANVRERLPGAQSADLYMLMLMDGIADEEAAKIETDENFCRKFVLKSNESLTDILDRTFLGPVSAQDDGGPVQNPVVVAIEAMVQTHPWARALVSEWERVLIQGNSAEAIAFLMEQAGTSVDDD